LDKYLSLVAPFIDRLGARILKGTRLLPFLVALILLAFALGSLPRSQPGGSLLFNSYWLIYLAYLIPLVALGLIIVFIAYLAHSWLPLSDALGFQLARKKKPGKKKQSRTVQLVTYIAVWAIAAYVLLQKCGGLFCKISSQPLNIATQLKDSVTGTGPGPALPLLSSFAQLSNIVQSNWFVWAFLGLLTVSTVIVARGVLVYGREVRADAVNQFVSSRAEGITAVQDAITILKGHLEVDPRSRIIHCYQRMVQAAQGLGATVTSDQTARELETAMRRTLFIDSSAIRELTNLFEEARYSLHSITEDDADQAQQWLVGIAEQMNTSLTPI
jgi:Domain of unknown function (DUF4129)